VILRDKAADLLTSLSPGTSRIALAGSIRRGMKNPKDIEIVAIPLYEHTLHFREVGLQGEMFGDRLPVPESVSLLDAELDKLYASTSWKLRADRGAGLRARFLIDRDGDKLDLFITDARLWGIIYTFRTGPAQFSHGLASLALKRGWHIESGLLHRHARPVRNNRRVSCLLGEECHLIADTHEEHQVFQALGLPWLEPEERTDTCLNQYLWGA